MNDGRRALVLLMQHRGACAGSHNACWLRWGIPAACFTSRLSLPAAASRIFAMVEAASVDACRRAFELANQRVRELNSHDKLRRQA